MKKQSKDFSARDAGVMFESLQKDIRIVAEQHGDIMKKLENHDVKFERVFSELYVMKGDINTMKGDIATTKIDIKDLKVEQVKRPEFTALAKRVATLEQ